MRLAALALALSAGIASPVLAQEASPPKVDWKAGPATVDVGRNLAQLQLPEGFSFAGPEDTRAVLARMGNRTDGSELAIVVPDAEEEDWFLVFEWNGIGYVKDEEKDEIDADALLASLREATEDGNAWRKEHNIPALHVTRWAEAPHYDPRTNHMVWAVVASDEGGGESLNYNVRVLGRDGVMSVTLVESPEKLAASKPNVERLLSGFSYKQGKRYAEWVPGDKLATYGLTGLVAAGAGAAAVKLGLFAVLGKLLAKMWKLVAVVGIGAVALVSKIWNAARGRMPATPPRPSGTDPGADPGAQA
jgi:uncharacterized membrane-anchored protein